MRSKCRKCREMYGTCAGSMLVLVLLYCCTRFPLAPGKGDGNAVGQPEACQRYHVSVEVAIFYQVPKGRMSSVLYAGKPGYAVRRQSLTE